jgi:uncharacterized protein
MRPSPASAGRRPFRILAAMYSTPGMFIARADSSDRALSDLVGKTIAFGAHRPGLVMLARYIGAGALRSTLVPPVGIEPT